MKKYSIMMFLSISMLHCTSGGDNVTELSGNYFFRDDGAGMHDILSHTANNREIPADVLSYGFNTDFIIAIQKPNKDDDPLYTKVNYINGRDSVYYWMIIHKPKSVLGPMNQAEFNKSRLLYSVPDKLKLNPIN